VVLGAEVKVEGLKAVMYNGLCGEIILLPTEEGGRVTVSVRIQGGENTQSPPNTMTCWKISDLFQRIQRADPSNLLIVSTLLLY
jgi:hypothetical protein